MSGAVHGPRRSRAAAALLAAALASLAACGEAPVQTMPVSLRGSISASGAPADAPVYVTVYHAWSGEGLLRHPLEPIARFETRLGALAHTLDHPRGQGEGLLVYAWLDADGDGVLCTPQRRGEPAGLQEVQEFPAATVRVALELTAACRGPEWFFPAAAPGPP